MMGCWCRMNCIELDIAIQNLSNESWQITTTLEQHQHYYLNVGVPGMFICFSSVRFIVDSHSDLLDSCLILGIDASQSSNHLVENWRRRRVFPRATLTTRVTVSIVTGRGVADAQSLGFGGATVGCLRYDFGGGRLDHFALNQCSEARKMGRFGRNKLAIKELLLCSLQMFPFSYNDGIMLE